MTCGSGENRRTASILIYSLVFHRRCARRAARELCECPLVVAVHLLCDLESLLFGHVDAMLSEHKDSRLRRM